MIERQLPDGEARRGGDFWRGGDRRGGDFWRGGDLPRDGEGDLCRRDGEGDREGERLRSQLNPPCGLLGRGRGGGR